MGASVVDGDLLSQDVEVIVNAWNRNIIPWWLLLPHGVSGAIKRRGGYAPFRELAKVGSIPVGGAVLTGAGRLPFRAIIHVAGIDMLWRASRESVAGAVRSAMGIVEDRRFASVAFPIIGAGTGGLSEDESLACMRDALEAIRYCADVRLVRYRRPR